MLVAIVILEVLILAMMALSFLGWDAIWEGWDFMVDFTERHPWILALALTVAFNLVLLVVL